ncbi:MAG: hypothetical protein KDA25_07565 [Phycisphaerales bacterium]|nr:hypothetical protein [Phycisphaerales bacterium]
MTSSVRAGDSCPADLDGDGVVGSADLAILIAAYDDSGPGDLDGDRVVTGADLGLLLAAFGPCAPIPAPVVTSAEIAWDEVTDAETEALGLREFDIFVQLEFATSQVLNVFDASIVATPSGFVHAPEIGGNVPLPESVWERNGLAYDSFVTIGLQYGDGNAVAVDPNFSSWAFQGGIAMGTGAGWFNADPTNAQGFADHFDGYRVRIATLTVAMDAQITGTISFICVNGAGAPEIASSAFTILASAPLADFDQDGSVDATDLASLLARWGPCCLGDQNGDSVVDVSDVVLISGAQGPCSQIHPCPADLNGDSFVDGMDILIALDHIGPCPICHEDLDDSGTVDSDDLIMILSNWSTQAP